MNTTTGELEMIEEQIKRNFIGEDRTIFQYFQKVDMPAGTVLSNSNKKKLEPRIKMDYSYFLEEIERIKKASDNFYQTLIDLNNTMYNTVEKEAGTETITRIVDSLGFKIIAALNIYTLEAPCRKIQSVLREARGK